MKPAFSDALYYPSIDVKNIAWLKTAALFWDSISTIVPEGYGKMRKSQDTEYLADIGFLKSIVVNPEDDIVSCTKNEIRELVLSEKLPVTSLFKAVGFLDEVSDTISATVNVDDIFGNAGSFLFSPESVQAIHEEAMEKLGDAYSDANGMFIGNNTDTHMTLLANKICENQGLAMVTDRTPLHNVSNVFRLGVDARTAKPLENSQGYAQGMLLNLALEELNVSPEGTFVDIIEFKKQHRDELGHFLSQLSRLTSHIYDTATSIESLQQGIRNIYKNEFSKAYKDLRNALKYSPLKLFSASAPLAVSIFILNSTFDFVMPIRLLGSGLVYLTASIINYSIEKRKILRENPYSYLLLAERNLL